MTVLNDGHDSVLQRVAAAEPGAAQEALDSYGSLVWSLARRLSPNKQQAETATEEIFSLLWRHADRYRPADGSEQVFVTMLARRRLIDRLSADQRRDIMDALPDDLNALADRTELKTDNPGNSDDEVARAARALRALDAPQQTTLKLCVLLGLAPDDIARAVALEPAQIRSHVRLGLLQIRQRISDGGV